MQEVLTKCLEPERREGFVSCNFLPGVQVVGSTALKDWGREYEQPLHRDQDRRPRLSTQLAAAARNEIEPKRDFCRHCSQTREGHWASGAAGSRLSNAGRWPLAVLGPRCPRRGHGTPVSVEGSDPNHVMAHTLGSTCAEVFLLGNPGCSFRKRESGCRQGASGRPRRGLTCRGLPAAGCCRLALWLPRTPGFLSLPYRLHRCSFFLSGAPAW